MTYKIIPLPKQAKDHTGKKFNRLTAIGPAKRTKHGSLKWLCQCECGNESVVRASHLLDGLIQSCGCLNAELTSARSTTHGLSKHPLYGIWTKMRERCNHTNNAEYHHYGGRGIKVCKRWNEFTAFLEDMGMRPNPKLSIDRIDNDGDYTPKNCRWATQKQQCRNKHGNRMIEFDDKNRCLTEWSEITGIKMGTLRKRIVVLGWPIEKALTEPVHA